MLHRAFATLALGGCLAAMGCQPHGEEPPQVSSDGRPAGVPESAIKVNDTLYMIPGSMDAGGCVEYSAHAVDGMAPAVVYYRRADGSFTPDRDEASC